MSRRLPVLLILSVVLLIAARLAGQAAENLSDKSRDRVLAAYRALPSVEREKQKIAVLPAGVQFVKIDASDRIRSASFGHTTTLLVPAGAAGKPADPNQAREYYVEYGRSTNAPAVWFGPFPIP